MGDQDARARVNARLAAMRERINDYDRAYEEALRGKPNRLPQIGHEVVENAPDLMADIENLRAENSRLKEQIESVRALFASIGPYKMAQGRLMAIGVSLEDSGRILSDVREDVNRGILHALGGTDAGV